MTDRQPDINATRRANLLLLIRAYTESQMALGVDPTGIGKNFAAALQISPSRLSQLKSARNFTDKLARQFEALQGHAPGWMDVPHESDVPTAGEEAFIALCRTAWNSQNAKGKKTLKRLVAETLPANQAPSSDADLSARRGFAPVS